MSFLGDLSPGQGLANNAFNLGQNAAAMGQQQNYFGGISNLGQQNQNTLDNAYGPNGFGGDTAYYAGLGASYGRAVPGEIYGGSSGPMGSVFDTGASAFNTYGVSPEMWSRMSPADMQKFNQIMAGQNAQPVSNGDPGASFDDRYSAAAPAASFDDRFGQYGGATQQQQQNQPAIDAVNNFAKGVPQLSDFGPNYGNPNQSMQFGGGASNSYGVDPSLWGRMSPSDKMSFNQQMASQNAMPVATSPVDTSWTTDSYGNQVPRAYGNTGADMYSPGAYAPSQPPEFGGNSPIKGVPSSGVIGPQMDPFTDYPWNGNPAANVDYRFPQNDWQTQNYINQLYQGLNNIGGGSTLKKEDFPGGDAAYSRGGG